MVLEAYGHQDVPFEKLVEELEPERNLSRTPLFQVMLVLQNAPEEEMELEGLQVSVPEYEGGGIAKFELSVDVQERAGGLKGIVEYDADLFSGERMRRMVEHWQTLLYAVIENCDQLISQLPLLSVQECQQLLEEWNSTKQDCSFRCVHELFEEQVGRSPGGDRPDFWRGGMDLLQIK